MPDRPVPVVGAGAVVALALPIFALAGWPLAGWGLGAALWAAAQALGLLLSRLRVGAGNLAASGVVGIGMTFRALAVGIVLIAVATSNGTVALAAALLYTLAYTLELGLSLASYFGGERT